MTALTERVITTSDLHVEDLELSMGPQHPATHGVLQIILRLNGERVVHADPVLGYLHRGKEKHAEKATYQQFFPMTDRLDYLQPLGNEVAYALAVEKLAGIELPPRAVAIRTLIAELMRLSAHLIWVGIGGLDVGATSIYFYAFRERENLFDILDALTGLRTNQEYIRIGGVAADVDRAVQRSLTSWLNEFPEHIDEFELLLTGNHIFYKRMKGIGKLTPEQAIELGLTGPCLRGTGIAVDLRKARPYLNYAELDFEVPVGTEGDAYDRYLVRIEEMRQSVRICKQILADLPSGSIFAEEYKDVLPPKGRVYTSMEEMIHQFKIVTDWCPPKGEVYQAVEAANGELGFYIVSQGENRPYRLKIRAPSFVNLQALKPMIEGAYFSDVVAAIASLHFIMGESDR